MANPRLKRRSRVTADSCIVTDLPETGSRDRQQEKKFEFERRQQKKFEFERRIENKCSCHDPETSTDISQDSFERAWKAIESQQMPTLEKAVQEMKEIGHGSTALLNTCRLTEKSGVAYSITLLAFCGFHGRKKMLDLLIKEGADLNSDCDCPLHGPGVPVSQMMLHCLIQHDYDKLEVSMLEYFIQKGAKLGRVIATRHIGLSGIDVGGVNYGMLDLLLSMKKIDCAKVLVNNRVDPINGDSSGGEEFDVVPMFQEYCDHGTNEFIAWVFSEFLPQHPEIDLDAFTQRIIKSIVNMKVKDEDGCFWQSVGRAPAHAVLTSGHNETTKCLVQVGKEEFDGLNLLSEKSCTGRTALHIAAENDDENSVQILLELGADAKASDNSDMTPFMIAVEKGHLNVAKAMLKKDPDLVSLHVHWALEKPDRKAFFEGCFEEHPKALLIAEDPEGNGIAHLAAASGNTEVFEILWSEEFAKGVFSNRNLEGKTPLQLSVENEHVNILKTLKTCVDGGRECTIPSWLRKLKKEWRNKMVPYILYASSCGSLGVVKHFIDSGHGPNISHSDRTPLLCAAEAGHDKIVAYLLQFKKVLTGLKEQEKQVDNAHVSPLLIAAQNGHTKCVTHLLQRGGNMLQRDSKDRNCLMLAIQNHHKDTALAILSEKDGLAALKRDQNPTPLQLLIKTMPDLAEYVLNKCVSQDETKRQISIDGEDFVDSPICKVDQPVKYNFEHLENSDKPSPHKHHDSHVLTCMIQHNRLNLLQHPLVENFLFQKFWAFPLFLFNLLFYFTFLVALNSFAVVIPRPGPESETCPESTVVAFDGPSSDCQGQSGDDQTFLRTAAILLDFLSFLGISVELVQLWMRGWSYFKDSDNYFQLALYILTILFIHGFGNECWCSTTWQWQIGAFAVFLSWLNFIFILKYMPYTAVPINMFLSICVTFLKLIFLPIVLVLAFGVPFYMVFVRTTTSSEEVGSLAAFKSPGHAIAKTILQLAGEFDFEATFNQGVLLYSPTTYILFFTFLITMPVLFSNLLIGLAVGDTQAEREKAEFTKLKVRVEFILERERSRGFLKRLHVHMRCKTKYSPSDELSYSSEDHKHWSRNSVMGVVLKLLGRDYSPENRFINFFLKHLGREYTRHAIIAKELKERNDDIYNTVMACNPVDAVKEDITKLKEDVGKLKQEMETLVLKL